MISLKLFLTQHMSESSSGADLGKILTVLLTTERRRSKNLGGPGACPPGIFFHFNCLKCPLLASGVNRAIYLQVAFFLDGALQTYELFHQSQCPCCNDCAARQVLSILSVTSCFVNMFLVFFKLILAFVHLFLW